MAGWLHQLCSCSYYSRAVLASYTYSTASRECYVYETRDHHALACVQEYKDTSRRYTIIHFHGEVDIPRTFISARVYCCA